MVNPSNDNESRGGVADPSTNEPMRTERTPSSLQHQELTEEQSKLWKDTQDEFDRMTTEDSKTFSDWEQASHTYLAGMEENPAGTESCDKAVETYNCAFHEIWNKLAAHLSERRVRALDLESAVFGTSSYDREKLPGFWAQIDTSLDLVCKTSAQALCHAYIRGEQPAEPKDEELHQSTVKHLIKLHGESTPRLKRKVTEDLAWACMAVKAGGLGPFIRPEAYAYVLEQMGTEDVEALS